MTDLAELPAHDAVQGASGLATRDQATLALFGHDLRAALSDVVGGLRLIAPDGLDALNRAQMERVQVSAEALARMLEQGLAVMLGETYVPHTELLDLQRYLHDLDVRWSGRALEKGIHFVLQQGPGLPVGLHADRVALDRVLSNLLGNAFNYGERGRVVCDVGIGADGGLRLTVRDDGPGFPASVFDRARSFQMRPALSAEARSGMGLHIAAELTERMGGRLTLRNLAPAGAEAQVDLPASMSENANPDPMESDPFLAGKRVLIADDNLTSQVIMARLATGLGAEVVVVSDGVEAIGRLEVEAFDLLIVDVEMPRLSGLDVIRCLRNTPGAMARLPVIAVTAYGLASNRKAIIAAGADDLLTKPVLCPVAFANAVRAVLMPQPVPGGRPGPVTLARPGEPVAMDDSRLHRLLDMAGPETGRDLLDRLVNDLCTVQRGLGQTDPSPDWQAIRTHSHVLISLAGAVGALRLQAEAEALNLLAHRMDHTELEDLRARILTDLERLIAWVSQVRRSYPGRAG